MNFSTADLLYGEVEGELLPAGLLLFRRILLKFTWVHMHEIDAPEEFSAPKIWRNTISRLKRVIDAAMEEFDLDCKQIDWTHESFEEAFIRDKKIEDKGKSLVKKLSPLLSAGEDGIKLRFDWDSLKKQLGVNNT